MIDISDEQNLHPWSEMMKKWLNDVKAIVIVGILHLGFAAFLMADPEISVSDVTAPQPQKLIARKIVVAQEPFRVNNLAYGYVVQGEQLHFQIIIDFNKNIDLSSINYGSNMRWLVKDMNGVYQEAYPAGGNIKVNGRQLIWTSKEPAISGTQKLHLKRTLKSAGGDHLSCESNCDGEGTESTVYDSGIYELLIEKI